MRPISLVELLRVEGPEKYKAHFAIWNGRHHPLDAFARDRNEWDSWNRWRGNKNEFNRAYIFSLMNVYTETNSWLFGGVYNVLGQHDGEYVIERSGHLSEFVGRLKLSYRLPGRNMRVRLENHIDQIVVSEILREPYSGQTFAGYEDIDLSYEQLEVIFRNDKPDWRGALENIKGVYLITDRFNGRKYVGSAYGEHGIWSRWKCYIETGHGWNDGFTKLLQEKGSDYARENFKFTLLEYRPTKADDKSIIAREGFWKNALLARTEFGYNKN